MQRSNWIAIGCLFLLSINAHAADTTLDDVKNWIVFDSSVLKQKKALKTDNWTDFDHYDTHYPAFSFSYPNTWKFNGSSVFYTSDGVKIAELTPALIKLQHNQTCTDAHDSEIKFLKNHVIKFGNLSGRKIVAEIQPDGTDETWHTYNYCLSNGKFAFVIHFWIKNLNADSEKTFDSVMSTFKIVYPSPNIDESSRIAR